MNFLQRYQASSSTQSFRDRFPFKKNNKNNDEKSSLNTTTDRLSFSIGATSNVKKRIQPDIRRHIAFQEINSNLSKIPTMDYTVKDGDTLMKLAAKFDTTPCELTSLNHLFSRTLFVGQVLKIPIKSDINNSSSKTDQDQIPSISVTPSNDANQFEAGCGNISRVSQSCRSPTRLSLSIDEERHYLNVESKYVTAREGTVTGLLTITPNSMLFSPWLGDPLLGEYGQERYTVDLSLKRVSSVALYNNSAAMFSEAEKRNEYQAAILKAEKNKRRLQQKLRQDSIQQKLEEASKECPPTEDQTNITNTSPSPNKPSPVERQKSDDEIITKHINFSSGIFAKPSTNNLLLEDISASLPSRSKTEEALSSMQPPNSTRRQLEFVNALPVDEKSLLQKTDWKESLLKRKPQFDSPPLYFCVFTPRQTRVTAETKNALTEYWFMVPTSKTEHLQQFLLNQCLSKCNIEGSRTRSRATKKRSSSWAGPQASSIVNSVSQDGEFDSGNEEDDEEKIGFVLVELENTKSECDYSALRLCLGAEFESFLQWEMVNLEFYQDDETELRVSPSMLDLDDAEPENLPLPEMVGGPSELLSSEKIRDLLLHLPAVGEGNSWTLLFSSSNDGFSLSRLYRNCKEWPNASLMVLKDTTGVIFGAMLSNPPMLNEHFYGNGSTYVFRWHPNFEKFSWTYKSPFFLKGDLKSFTIGCADGHVAIWFDDSLNHGRSQPCATFGSPSLPGKEDFIIQLIEVWSFDY